MRGTTRFTINIILKSGEREKFKYYDEISLQLVGLMRVDDEVPSMKVHKAMYRRRRKLSKISYDHRHCEQTQLK